MAWKRVSFEFELDLNCNRFKHTIYIYKGSSLKKKETIELVNLI